MTGKKPNIIYTDETVHNNESLELIVCWTQPLNDKYSKYYSAEHIEQLLARQREAWLDLHIAANALVSSIGMDGSLKSTDLPVADLLNALYEIDKGYPEAIRNARVEDERND